MQWGKRLSLYLVLTSPVLTSAHCLSSSCHVSQWRARLPLVDKLLIGTGWLLLDPPGNRLLFRLNKPCPSASALSSHPSGPLLWPCSLPFVRVWLVSHPSDCPAQRNRLIQRCMDICHEWGRICGTINCKIPFFQSKYYLQSFNSLQKTSELSFFS